MGLFSSFLNNVSNFSSGMVPICFGHRSIGSKIHMRWIEYDQVKAIPYGSWQAARIGNYIGLD